MNRRDMLKRLSMAAAGTMLAGYGIGRSVAVSRETAGAPPSLFLLTDAPERDLARLRERLPRAVWEALHATTAPVAPSAQDLTVLQGGTLLDPGREGALPEGIAGLAAELRARRAPGTTLLSLEPRRTGARAAVFTVDGVPRERVDLGADYRRIEIAGAQGLTVFRVEGGRLSVVSSSCRHELCKKAGARHSGRIICAPNRLVASLPAPASAPASVPGGAPGSVLDAVTG